MTFQFIAGIVFCLVAGLTVVDEGRLWRSVLPLVLAYIGGIPYKCGLDTISYSARDTRNRRSSGLS